MELPFEKTVSRFWQQKLYTPVMREETQEYKLPEGMPDVGRIIAAWGQVVLRGKEWRSRHIGLSGGVMVWVLYARRRAERPDGSKAGSPFPPGWSTATTATRGSSGRSACFAAWMPEPPPPGR